MVSRNWYLSHARGSKTRRNNIFSFPDDARVKTRVIYGDRRDGRTRRARVVLWCEIYVWPFRARYVAVTTAVRGNEMDSRTPQRGRVIRYRITHVAITPRVDLARGLLRRSTETAGTTKFIFIKTYHYKIFTGNVEHWKRRQWLSIVENAWFRKELTSLTSDDNYIGNATTKYNVENIFNKEVSSLSNKHILENGWAEFVLDVN